MIEAANELRARYVAKHTQGLAEQRAMCATHGIASQPSYTLFLCYQVEYMPVDAFVKARLIQWIQAKIDQQPTMESFTYRLMMRRLPRPDWLSGRGLVSAHQARLDLLDHLINEINEGKFP